MQYWEITSKTCKHLPLAEQEVYNPTTQIMTVKVGSLTRVEYTIDFIVLFLSSIYEYNVEMTFRISNYRDLESLGNDNCMYMYLYQNLQPINSIFFCERIYDYFPSTIANN